MKTKEETALKIAQLLLQIKAIKLNLITPYTWTSGWKSPIYCENRITLSYPAIRTYIRQEFVNIITEDFGDIDVIVGVATGGIAHGALVAQDLGLPFAYVRSSAKGHGLTSRIEGVIESRQSVIVIEDLISTGGSSMNVVEALRNTGANVKGLLSIFNYGFKVAEDTFSKAACSVHSLSNYKYLIDQAQVDDYIRKEDRAVLKKWRENPAKWKIM